MAIAWPETNICQKLRKVFVDKSYATSTVAVIVLPSYVITTCPGSLESPILGTHRLSACVSMDAISHMNARRHRFSVRATLRGGAPTRLYCALEPRVLRSSSYACAKA